LQGGSRVCDADRGFTMRVTRVLIACCLLPLLSAPTLAQEKPTRSVGDYLCLYVDYCSQQDQSKPPKGSRPAPPPRTIGLFKVPVPQDASAGQSASENSGGLPGHHASRERRMDLRLSFLLGSAELTRQARAEAGVFADALQRPQLITRRFLIEGHTDSSGSRLRNLDLSRRRAAAVVDYLASLGVERDRLDARGYGPDRPLPGHRPTSPDNRRVEAKLL